MTLALKTPEVVVPKDWEPVEPFRGFDTVGQFIPHTLSDGRLLVRYFRDGADGSMKAWAWFGPGAEGAPGRVHGGSVSAIMDEVLGAAVWLTGMPVVTARLGVKYRRPLKVGTVCEIETKVTMKGGRRALVHGTLKAREDGIIAEAEAVYFRIPDSEISEELAEILAARRNMESK